VFAYETEPYARFADEGQPLFFRRRYGGSPEPPQEIGGMMFVSLAPAEAIWIYGYSTQSRYAEDRALDPGVWATRRAFWGWHYSVMEPRGEPGYIALADVTEEITREEFEAAAERGWS